MAEMTTEKHMESFRSGLNKTLIEKLINVNRELKAKLEYEKELYANCRTLYTELEGENEELKARIVDLEESEKQSIETMKIVGINCIGDLVERNEELKESLRSIQQMGKEEPCERIESLMEDVQRLTTENGKLEDLSRELSQNLEERNLKSKMLEKDYMELRLNMAGIRGELIAYKYVISQMFAKK